MAILSSESFDAALVDPASVMLAGAPVATSGNGTPHASLEDVNGDGLADLSLQFIGQDLQLTAGDTEAVLTGKLFDGQRIRGSDIVRIVGRPANPGKGNNPNSPDAGIASALSAPTTDSTASSSGTPSQPALRNQVDEAALVDRRNIRPEPALAQSAPARSPPISDERETDDLVDLDDELLDLLVADLPPQ